MKIWEWYTDNLQLTVLFLPNKMSNEDIKDFKDMTAIVIRQYERKNETQAPSS